MCVLSALKVDRWPWRLCFSDQFNVTPKCISPFRSWGSLAEIGQRFLQAASWCLFESLMIWVFFSFIGVMSVVSAVLKRYERGVVFIIPCYKYILLLSSTVQKPVLTKLDLVINSGKKQMCFAFIHDLFSNFFFVAISDWK